MKLAVMQPYLLPYIGYFQLINAADLFIVYDNIKYTKKGWINRNRLLQNGKDVMFSLPLKQGSDALDVRDRELAADFNRNKLLNQVRGAYRTAPYFSQTMPLIEEVLGVAESNLFGFLYNSIARTCAHLNIATEIRISSDVAIDHHLKSQDKVLALCAAVGARAYLNSIGGQALYSREEFQARGIELKFIRSMPLEYAQFGNEFVPWLSIIDVLMFNPLTTVKALVNSGYELL